MSPKGDPGFALSWLHYKHPLEAGESGTCHAPEVAWPLRGTWADKKSEADPEREDRRQTQNSAEMNSTLFIFRICVTFLSHIAF